MAVSDDQIEFVLELFEGVGPLTTRKMFGGLGIYADGTIFAVVMSDGSTRLKGAGAMQDRLTALGLERWTYQREGKAPTAMPYWALAEDMLDDPEAASALAREALSYL